jgi:hypothetical protein
MICAKFLSLREQKFLLHGQCPLLLSFLLLFRVDFSRFIITINSEKNQFLKNNSVKQYC